MTAQHLLKFNKQQFEAWKNSTIGILFFGTLERETKSLSELVLQSDENELRLKGRLDELRKMLIIDFESLSTLQEFLLKEQEEKENESSFTTDESADETTKVSTSGETDRRDTDNEGNSGHSY